MKRNESITVLEHEPLLPDRAAMFKALGEPTRLRIFDFLRWCCCKVSVEESGDVRPVEGPTVGEVCCQITGADRINSTISEHLKELRLAGLITVERRGKNMVCGVNTDVIVSLAEYFEDAISQDNGASCCCENSGDSDSCCGPDCCGK